MGVSLRPSLAGCLFAATTVGLAGLACSGDSSSPSGSPRPTLTLPSPGPSPMVFEFTGGHSPTPEQRELTEQIINDDPTVRALVGGSPTQLGQIGIHVYAAKEETDILVGTTARVTLTQPHDVNGIEVPQARVRNYYGFWPDELQARYSAWADHNQVVSVRNLSEFEVTVDLVKRRIVGIWIYSNDYADQELTQPTPYTDPFFDAQARESDEAESIAKNDPAVAAILDALDTKADKSYTYEVGEHRFARVSGYSDHASSASGDWPVILDQDPETGDYRSETIHVEVDAATDVVATVDLDIGEVIDVETRERD